MKSQECLDRPEAFGAHQVEASLAFRTDLDEARVTQDLQVLGHRLLGDLKVRRDLTHRTRLIPHEQQHRPTARFGQGREGCFGGHETSVGASDGCIKPTLV